MHGSLPCPATKDLFPLSLSSKLEMEWMQGNRNQNFKNKENNMMQVFCALLDFFEGQHLVVFTKSHLCNTSIQGVNVLLGAHHVISPENERHMCTKGVLSGQKLT